MSKDQDQVENTLRFVRGIVTTTLAHGDLADLTSYIDHVFPSVLDEIDGALEGEDTEPTTEPTRERGFYVVLTRNDERYLVDTYSAATAAFIVESQFNEVVDSVHTTAFKKILLMGANTNGNDQTTSIETPDSDPASQDTGDGFANDDEIIGEAEARG